MGELKLLNKCPVCGNELEYSALMQYSNIFKVLQNGKLSKNRIRKEDNGSMECGYLSCVNRDCDFVTDCELRCKTYPEIKIAYDDGGKLYYKIENN